MRPGVSYTNRWLGVAIFAAIVTVTVSVWIERDYVSVYGLLAFALLTAKIGLSLLPSNNRQVGDGDVSHLSVGVLLPVFNEDPTIFRGALDSILAQSHPVSQIVVVDDASLSTEAADLADEYALRYPDVISVVRISANRGKREAMAVGVRMMPEVDVYLGVDSDTMLDRDAVLHGLKPFLNPKVKAATGIVSALNPNVNMLTGLTDLKYLNAFLVERGAYSAFGSVLCVCGSLAFYRGDVMRRNLDEFLGQTLRGVRQVFGDDRHMTNLSLREGNVVLVRESFARTAVPERFGHFLRQQVRWGKSFFRESTWVLGNLQFRSAARWLTSLELLRWATVMVVLPVIGYRCFTTGWDALFYFGGWLVLMSYAHSVQYVTVSRPDVSGKRKAAMFLCSPLYGVLSAAVLVPLRLWSLATLSSGSWGTRGGVEVTANGIARGWRARLPGRTQPELEGSIP